MKNDWLIWLAIGALLIAATGTGVYVMARGIRNNNPGNIRHGSSQWQGMSADQSKDDAFVQFDSPVYGIRALTKLVKNYQSRHGLNTIRQIINRWAPPTENITSAYVEHVAREAGVNPDAPIDVNDHIVSIVKTIIKHENGENPYDDETILTGIGMA